MIKPKSNSSESLPQTLALTDYIRQRFDPKYGDALYIHLSDIRLFLNGYSQESYCKLLDYGCGGSPYKGIFRARQYIRADYVDSENIDFRIGDDGKLQLPDNAVDAVLSTQVLEHVYSPQKYLSEAFRVLSPGGKFILTTHGIWEDHGCPYDFRRWTADGLEMEFKEQGFEIAKIKKVTTEGRAIVFLLGQRYEQFRGSRRNLPGFLFWLLWKGVFASLEHRHNWMDTRFADCRLVDAQTPGHGIYLALGIEGKKPS